MTSDVFASGIVAVLRADSVAACVPALRVLLDAGIPDIELTMTIPGLLDDLAELVEALPEASLGVGTVTRSDEVRRAVASGARFIVSPAVVPDVMDASRDAGVSVFPGALTPTEILRAARLGATAVKLFPAATVGPGYLGHLRGPLPDVRLLPSGGIALEDISAWLRAGATAVSLGGPLLGDALEGGSLRALAARAHAARAAVESVRAA